MYEPYDSDKSHPGSLNRKPSHSWGDRSGNRAELPSNWSSLRKRVLERDNYLCQHIRHDTGMPCFATGTVVDHKVPVAEGGTHGMGNLQVLCQWHSNQKTGQEAARGKQRAQQKKRPKNMHPGMIFSASPGESAPATSGETTPTQAAELVARYEKAQNARHRVQKSDAGRFKNSVKPVRSLRTVHPYLLDLASEEQ